MTVPGGVYEIPPGSVNVSSGQPTERTQQVSNLSESHQRLIDDSGISAEVATERGYKTVTVKKDLERLGFADKQRIVPALLVPVHGVDGSVVTYQTRPDTPRVNPRTGKPIKYETPAGSTMALDVPVRVRPVLADPLVPLIVTEGARKADAAASAGLAAIALLGVWIFRGKNSRGGKTALPDWEYRPQRPRRVRGVR